MEAPPFRCDCNEKVSLLARDFKVDDRCIHTVDGCYDASLIPAFRSLEERLRAACETLARLDCAALARVLRGDL